jgi:hypothetical protein
MEGRGQRAKGRGQKAEGCSLLPLCGRLRAKLKTQNSKPETRNSKLKTQNLPFLFFRK